MTSRSCPLRFKDLVTQTTSLSGPVPPPNTTPQNVPEILQIEVAMDASVSRQAASIEVAVEPSTNANQAVPRETGTSSEAVSQPQLRYNSPQVIYQKYTAERSAWYASQPSGAIKTNQLYRRAMGLPLRYNKRSYEWCLDYKQMSKRCVTSSGAREWSKEEMMAYLDWSKAEDDRVEERVAKEMGDNPLANRRRGTKEIWESVEQDIIEQQTLYSNNNLAGDCIIVDT